jgi:hypothetical protein
MQRAADQRARGLRFASGGWIEEQSGDGVKLVHDDAEIEQVTNTVLVCWNRGWNTLHDVDGVRFVFDGPILAPPHILLTRGEAIELRQDDPCALALRAGALAHNEGMCAEVRHAGKRPTAAAEGEVEQATGNVMIVGLVACAVVLAGGATELLAELHLGWIALVVVLVPLWLLRINREAEVKALLKREPLGMFWLQGVPVRLRMRTDPEVQARFEKRERRRAALREAVSREKASTHERESEPERRD